MGSAAPGVAAAQAKVGAPPSDVSLRIRFKEPRTRYVQGETITIVLEYASATPSKYGGSTSSYDRSGRLNRIESYLVTPREGTRDPLAIYYGAGVFPLPGGGLSSWFTLGSKSFTLERDLNEWVRFDRPGTYSISVASTRVGLARSDPRGFPSYEKFIPLTSNSLELEIVAPSGEWQSKQLRLITADLDSADSTKSLAARRALRFLGTRGAALEMARRTILGQSYGLELAASPFLEDATAEMERLIDAPDVGVAGDAVYTLAQLELFERLPGPLESLEPRAGPDELDAHAREIRRRAALYDEIRASCADRLTAAFPRKEGDARLLTLEAAIGAASTRSAAELSRELAASLDRLPADAQLAWLEYRWTQIAYTEALPSLRRLYRGLPDAEVERRSRVLQRLIDLSPEEGRDAALAEIRRPRLRIEPWAVLELADKTLPELDEAFASWLNALDDERLEARLTLIARFGSPSLLPRIAETYDRRAGRWACAPQTSFLAYFLNADPVYGLQRLREAMRFRRPTACYESALRDVANMRLTPEVERVAIEALDDGNLQVVMAAAGVLSAAGSPDAESALWRRLEELKKSRGDAPLLTERPNTREEIDVVDLERVIREALAGSDGWALDAASFERLVGLAVSVSARDTARAQGSELAAGVPVFYAVSPSGSEYLTVSDYHCTSLDRAIERMALYPTGTVFAVSVRAPDGGDAAVARLEQLAAASGMKVVRVPVATE